LTKDLNNNFIQFDNDSTNIVDLNKEFQMLDNIKPINGTSSVNGPTSGDDNTQHLLVVAPQTTSQQVLLSGDSSTFNFSTPTLVDSIGFTSGCDGDEVHFSPLVSAPGNLPIMGNRFSRDGGSDNSVGEDSGQDRKVGNDVLILI